jgi:hypothetical protein
MDWNVNCCFLAYVIPDVYYFLSTGHSDMSCTRYSIYRRRSLPLFARSNLTALLVVVVVYKARFNQHVAKTTEMHLICNSVNMHT